MKKLVPVDMPKWARDLFEKKANVNLNFLENGIFKTYIQNLPQRSSLAQGKLKVEETKIRDEHLQLFNSVDFPKISPQNEQYLKDVLTDFFKNK